MERSQNDKVKCVGLGEFVIIKQKNKKVWRLGERVLVQQKITVPYTNKQSRKKK
jgi:hypothetical protein